MNDENEQHRLEVTVRVLNDLAHSQHLACHKAGWWNDSVTGEKIERNPCELLFLVVSELVEAGEGLRTNKMDDHLPHRKSIEVELADAVLRIMDFAGAHRLDIGGAVIEKMAYNQHRSDHKLKARQQPGGKKW